MKVWSGLLAVDTLLESVGCGLFSVGVLGHVSTDSPIMGVTFPAVVVGSAVIGTSGGLAVVAYHVRQGFEERSNRWISIAVGGLLSVLALFSLLPIATERPVLSGGSVVIGGTVAVLLPHDTRRGATAASAALALTSHQLLEGMVLAAAYIAGGTVGVLTAVVLTVHTVAETAAVGGSHAVIDRPFRGVGAVVLMQGVYVVAAAGAYAWAVTVPPSTEQFVTALVGTVLLIAGIHECRCSIHSY